MRITEGAKFLYAFKNEAARHFVQNILKKNYAEAIMFHHPDNSKLSGPKVEEKCSSMIDEIFYEIDKVKARPDQLFPLLNKFSRNNPDRAGIWFEEILEAYHNYKHHHKLKRRYDQLKPYINGSTYCDIGCGGGDLVAYFKEHHPEIQEAAGIDVMDWRTPEIKDGIDFQQLDFAKPGHESRKQYDTLSCLAVLHHVGNTEAEIGTFLKNAQTAMHSKSRLIIEEDVIINDVDCNQNEDLNRQITGLNEQQPIFREFLQYSGEEQRDIIILIDILANCILVGVPDMPFPCGFHSLKGWQEVFKNNNFRLISTNIQGFVQYNFNQSSHVHFVLGLEDGLRFN